MVKPFQFSQLPRIYFRNGVLADLSSIIRQYGSRILIVTGKSSFLNSAYSQKLFDDLKKKEIDYHILTISGEPSPEIIDMAVKEFHNEKIELVAGIGGGSVMDAGKAVSAMMYKTDSVAEYLEGVGTKEHAGIKLPYIAIPTTSGTGSEATKNAVLSRVGKDGFKRSLRHDNLVPDIALVDPGLTLSCPKANTATSGMDCFTQLLESFLSNKAVEYTDALAIEGLKAIKTSLLRTYQDGTDIEARTGMSFAALTSGICLANAGLGAVHGFASSIGGLYNIPHGLICGTLMAPANEINVRELRNKNDNPSALKKYALLGRLFTDISDKPDDYYTDSFIQYLHNVTAELNLPGLSGYGVEEKDVDSICRNTEIKNNPVKLTVNELSEILRMRLL